MSNLGYMLNCTLTQHSNVRIGELRLWWTGKTMEF